MPPPGVNTIDRKRRCGVGHCFDYIDDGRCRRHCGNLQDAHPQLDLFRGKRGQGTVAILSSFVPCWDAALRELGFREIRHSQEPTCRVFPYEGQRLTHVPVPFCKRWGDRVAGTSPNGRSARFSPPRSIPAVVHELLDMYDAWAPWQLRWEHSSMSPEAAQDYLMSRGGMHPEHFGLVGRPLAQRRSDGEVRRDISPAADRRGSPRGPDLRHEDGHRDDGSLDDRRPVHRRVLDRPPPEDLRPAEHRERARGAQPQRPTGPPGGQCGGGAEQAGSVSTMPTTEHAVVGLGANCRSCSRPIDEQDISTYGQLCAECAIEWMLCTRCESLVKREDYYCRRCDEAVPGVEAALGGPAAKGAAKAPPGHGGSAGKAAAAQKGAVAVQKGGTDAPGAAAAAAPMPETQEGREEQADRVDASERNDRGSGAAALVEIEQDSHASRDLDAASPAGDQVVTTGPSSHAFDLCNGTGIGGSASASAGAGAVADPADLGELKPNMVKVEIQGNLKSKVAYYGLPLHGANSMTASITDVPGAQLRAPIKVCVQLSDLEDDAVVPMKRSRDGGPVIVTISVSGMPEGVLRDRHEVTRGGAAFINKTISEVPGVVLEEPIVVRVHVVGDVGPQVPRTWTHCTSTNFMRTPAGDAM